MASPERGSPLRHEFQHLRSTILARLLLASVLAIGTAVAGCGNSAADARLAFDRGDYVTALKLWRERADSGDTTAQNYMGIHYHLGLGVARDYGEAVRWYRRAAENGNADAQRNLGTMYYLGLGVAQDKGWAYGWYYVAAGNGNKKAEDYMLSIPGELTPNHIMLAKRQIREYLESKGIAARVMRHGSVVE